MSKNDPNLNPLIPKETLRKILEASASVSQLIPQIGSAQIDAMKSLIADISTFYSEDFMRGIDDLSHGLNETARQISQISLESVQDLRSSLWTVQDALVGAIAVARPYMSPDQIQEAEDIFPDIFEPAPSGKPKKSAPKLSLNTFLALFSLLITIIFGIISTLPDKQLEQITEQNAVLIEQNEELYSLESEKLAVLRQLLETAEEVSDALDALEQDPYTVSDAPEELLLPADDPAEIVDNLDKPVKPEDKPTDNTGLDQAKNTEQ